MSCNSKGNCTDRIISVCSAFMAVILGISSCHQSSKANEHYEKQAAAALIEHEPYIAVISQFDDGSNSHGIFVRNYASGLAIVEELRISNDIIHTLTADKWREILRKNKFTENEIQCFSFSTPQKDMGLSGNHTVPLVKFSSQVEKEIFEKKEFNICHDIELIKKLENIPIEIKYKSRLPSSKTQTAKIFKLYGNQ